MTVDDRLRTTNPRIYAAGDVCSAHKFTHTADAQARIVIQNALFLGRARASALTLPWCTYTDPEVAHVGLYEREAAARGIAVRTFVQELADVDRAVLDGETEGFVKVHVRAGTDRILGATIVARHAGEMMPELTLAIATGIGLGRIASVIHPYPTQAEAIRKLGDAYNRTRLTPRVKRLFARLAGLDALSGALVALAVAAAAVARPRAGARRARDHLVVRPAERAPEASHPAGEALTFKKIERRTRYSVVADADGHVLRPESAAAASARL